jgi:hypothetical protein
MEDVVPWSIIYGEQNRRHKEEIDTLKEELVKMVIETHLQDCIVHKKTKDKKTKDKITKRGGSKEDDLNVVGRIKLQPGGGYKIVADPPEFETHEDYISYCKELFKDIDITAAEVYKP